MEKFTEMSLNDEIQLPKNSLSDAKAIERELLAIKFNIHDWNDDMKNEIQQLQLDIKILGEKMDQIASLPALSFVDKEIAKEIYSIEYFEASNSLDKLQRAFILDFFSHKNGIKFF
jgi:hypothetical protein